jgi:hypothetical protein
VIGAAQIENGLKYVSPPMDGRNSDRQNRHLQPAPSSIGCVVVTSRLRRVVTHRLSKPNSRSKFCREAARIAEPIHSLSGRKIPAKIRIHTGKGVVHRCPRSYKEMFAGFARKHDFDVSPRTHLFDRKVVNS